MDLESFTYTISSVQKTNNSQTEYIIDVGGFSSSFNNYHIEVLNCVLDGGVLETNGYLVLAAENLASNGYFCSGSLPANECIICTIGTNSDILMSNGGISFLANNLRMKRQIKFKFYTPELLLAVNDVDINVDVVTDWILTLKITPVK